MKKATSVHLMLRLKLGKVVNLFIYLYKLMIIIMYFNYLYFVTRICYIITWKLSLTINGLVSEDLTVHNDDTLSGK